MIEIVGKRAPINSPVMLDLETMGTGANSVILAIGAVRFYPDSREILDTFYAVLSTVEQEYLGSTTDEATEKWWLSQSKEARTVLSSPMTSLYPALQAFSDWMDAGSEVWGNGADFDNAMLAELHRKVGMTQPWKFFNNRCYRTMKNMFPRVTFKRMGVYHNAVDDAKSQAVHLMNIMERMRDRSLS
jgi:hypothetical protein